MSRSVIEFPASVKMPSPESIDHEADNPGGPASRVHAGLVLRHARQTRDVVTVARRMKLRANDVFLVVLKRMELLEKKAA